ncbi:hypothetical protein [Mocis latipes granulovirus]|uniref:Uncharacterized protein n=1 Tax=Mocis latipes granulovirus TaxID=2072024 RepID=A0A162GX77_9BBAC|nr:hypothetical protein [Mocis latipes granulovirus]AKR17539.1 hypothetical protein [Mocis latipes granulovirus]
MSRRNSFSNTMSSTIKSVKRRFSGNETSSSAKVKKLYVPEDLLKPISGSTDTAQYNYPSPENVYNNIDVDASDAVFAEETQPIIKINPGNIYDDPEYQAHVVRLAKNSLNHLLKANNTISINQNYVSILQAPQLPHTSDLFVIQYIINKYIQQVLNLDLTLYQMLQEWPGVNAPLYKAYVLVLINSMPNMDVKFLHKFSEALYTFYLQWVDQVPAMIEIVLNTNGHDVIKEIMTLINQSVYKPVYLLLKANNITNIEYAKQFTNIPFAELSDKDFPSDEIKNKINNEQRIISNRFLDKFNATVFQQTYKRYYLLPKATPNLDVPYIPKIITNVLNTEIIRLIRLQRTPADLFDYPLYQRPLQNTVYIENINESNA